MKKSNSLLKKLPGYIGYGVGAVGLDLSYGMFYSFLSYYLSSVLGLKPAFLLILTPIARIWDGINDPMMGTIVDNTRTKFGKYRPWILIGAFSNGGSYAPFHILRYERNKALHIYSRHVYSLGNDQHHGGYSLLVDDTLFYKRS